MRKLGLVLGGALLLAGCAARTPPPPVDLNNPLMAPGYMAQAASADQFEIQSGQLAMQASQNAAVRNIANMLITDHTQTTQSLMAAAAAARLQPPPPTILPAHQAMLDQLRSAGTGYSFDQAFQQVQIQAHQQALALHQGYATSGDVPALRTAAGGTVPIVQRHLSMLQTLQVAPPPPPVRRSGERG